MASLEPVIRLARSEDKDAVLRFTEHTWEFGEYISEVWDNWLNEPGSKMIIALIHNQPAAMVHISILAPGEAWLEGLRVDPAYRRIGLAQLLTMYCITAAASSGVHTLRFITSSLNAPVHRLAKKLVFSKTSSIQPYHAEIITEDMSNPFSIPTQQDLSSLLPLIKDYPLFKAMNGLFSSGWRFLSINDQQIRKKAHAGMLRIIRDPGGIKAVAILEFKHNGDNLLAGYADGKPEIIPELALALKKEARRLQAKSVSIRLPEVPWIQSIFIEAGFRATEDHPFWIYEKGIKVV